MAPRRSRPRLLSYTGAVESKAEPWSGMLVATFDLVAPSTRTSVWTRNFSTSKGAIYDRCQIATLSAASSSFSSTIF